MAGKLVKPQGGVNMPGGVGREADDKWLSTSFPTLWSYLTQALWEDGTARVTSTCTLFVEQGMVKVCLSDRAADRSAWSSGDTLEEAAMRLEDALANDRAEWRLRPSEARGGPPRRK